MPPTTTFCKTTIQEYIMTFTTSKSLFGTIGSSFSHPEVTFTPAEKPKSAGLIAHLPSKFADSMRRAMDEALEAGDVNAYLRAKRSLRSHYRFHAMKHRDGSKFPLSHDDHLASVAHQANYHAKGDVERMSVGLQEVSEWSPPLLRAMDASAGSERVSYDVPGIGITHDRLSAAQRDLMASAFDRDKDELPSDFELSTFAEAERLGVSIEDFDRPWSLDRPMSAKPARHITGCE